MPLCDKLEASLNAAAATSSHLLDALLVEALAPGEPAVLDMTGRAARIVACLKLNFRILPSNNRGFVILFNANLNFASQKDVTPGGVSAAEI